MYQRFFGLREEPFKLNPDPRYLFLTPDMQDAWSKLRYGIDTRQGLMVFTGEVGTGKTTLINRLLDCLHEQQTHTAFIFNSHLETRHLFDFVLADFGVSPEVRNIDNPLIRLNHWLRERYRENRIAVLIVDEAQGLSFDLLEEIRLLLNAETPHAKLLQVVLVGQPELEETLKRRELRQLRQRIVIRCKTAPLTGQETHAYIRTRLRIAGSVENEVFTPDAIDSIHFYARGIPRVINLLCEHSLINAYVDNVRPVPPAIVDQVAHEFEFDNVHCPVLLHRDSTPELPSISTQQSASEKVPAPRPPVEEAACTSMPTVAEKPTISSHGGADTTTAARDRTLGTANSEGATQDPLLDEAAKIADSEELTSEQAFVLLSALAPKSRTIPSPAHLHVVGSRAHPNDRRGSSNSSPSRIETSPSALTEVAGTRRKERSSGMWFRALQALLNRSTSSWKACWTSIVCAARPVAPALLGWFRSVMGRLRLVLGTCSEWLQEPSQMAFPSMPIPLIRWLQRFWG